MNFIGLNSSQRQQSQNGSVRNYQRPRRDSPAPEASRGGRSLLGNTELPTRARAPSDGPGMQRSRPRPNPDAARRSGQDSRLPRSSSCTVTPTTARMDGSQIKGSSRLPRKPKRVTRQGRNEDGQLVKCYEDGSYEIDDEYFPSNQLGYYDMDGQVLEKFRPRRSLLPDLEAVAAEDEEDEESPAKKPRKVVADEEEAVVEETDEEPDILMTGQPAPTAETLSSIAASDTSDQSKKPMVDIHRPNEKVVMDMGSFVIPTSISSKLSARVMRWRFGSESNKYYVVLGQNTNFTKVNPLSF
jgi:hypothetical protein